MKSVVMMKFLSEVASHLGVGLNTFVVGGAVRNFLMDPTGERYPIKDIDVVIDSVALGGRGSDWFSRKIQQKIPVRCNLTTNQYGVSILTISEPWTLEGFEMKGETLEVSNARRESYGGSEGKGYKPHLVEPATIDEDLLRRDFSVNTLLWRLLDLRYGPEGAVVIDITGLGRAHLEQGVLVTPSDPDKTFSDDPTRLLRGVKFCVKYGFKIAPQVESSIRRNADKLKKMPWDAVRKILTDDILDGPAPRRSVEIMQYLGLATVLKEMLFTEQGFASALARSLNDAEVHLILDLLDLGWTMKTPLSFLNRAGQIRVREVLLEHANSTDFEKNFLEALRKPPVDQKILFAKFGIPLKERGLVTQIARGILLREPLLIEHPNAFLGEVETELGAKYKAVRVASRFQL
jgi:tRNA nucleotidyltransferase/poly(A) polymerase